jgi:hypothetical protein
MAWVDTQFEEPVRVEYARFDRFGDALEGNFAGTEERKNKFDKMEVQILVKVGEGSDGVAEIKSVRANQRLLAQVAPIKRGALVRIEYIEDRPNDGVDKQGEPLKPSKIFRVQTDSTPGARAAPRPPASRREDPPPPSDDDIPF